MNGAGAWASPLAAALGFASVVLLFTEIDELLLEAHEHGESSCCSWLLMLASTDWRRLTFGPARLRSPNSPEGW